LLSETLWYLGRVLINAQIASAGYIGYPKNMRALVEAAGVTTAMQPLIRFIQKSLASSRKLQLTVLLG